MRSITRTVSREKGGGPEERGEGDWVIPQMGSKNQHACFESTKRDRTEIDWGTEEGEPISREASKMV